MRSKLASYFMGRIGVGVLAGISRRIGKAFRGNIDRTRMHIDDLYTVPCHSRSSRHHYLLHHSCPQLGRSRRW